MWGWHAQEGRHRGWGVKRVEDSGEEAWLEAHPTTSPGSMCRCGTTIQPSRADLQESTMAVDPLASNTQTFRTVYAGNLQYIYEVEYGASVTVTLTLTLTPRTKSN